jgi:hypothetical protein
MQLQDFDKEKAKSQAKQFLGKSIYTLGIILGVDTSLIDENTTNPYNESDAEYQSFNCLRSEVVAYNKL